MRDVREGRKFGRTRSQRKALLSGLGSSLVISGRIKTTEAKAKELRMFIEPLITKARTGSLTARKALGAALSSKAAKKLFDDGKKYDRKGGYTRITKLGTRSSDAAKMVYIEIL